MDERYNTEHMAKLLGGYNTAANASIAIGWVAVGDTMKLKEACRLDITPQ